MNYTTAIFLINAQVRAIKVSYEPAPQGKTVSSYLYKTMDQSIKVGDFVVVTTDTRHNLTVCKVEEVDVDITEELSSNLDVKWIVSKVDMEESNRIKSQEAEALNTIKAAEKRKKVEELRASVLAHVKEEALIALPIYTKE